MRIYAHNCSYALLNVYRFTSEETAAEILYHRADAGKDFMGLMNFLRNQPTLQEVRAAKNYLDEKELRSSPNLCVNYL